MTAPESVAAKLALKLSERDKSVILRARETVLMDRMKLEGKSKSLRQMGIAVSAWRGGDLLTQLGLEVHAIILKEAGK